MRNGEEAAPRERRPCEELDLERAGGVVSPEHLGGKVNGERDAYGAGQGQKARPLSPRGLDGASQAWKGLGEVLRGNKSH